VVLRMNSGSTTRQAVGVVGICDCGLPGFVVAVTPNALLFPPLLACLLAFAGLLADRSRWLVPGRFGCVQGSSSIWPSLACFACVLWQSLSSPQRREMWLLRRGRFEQAAQDDGGRRHLMSRYVSRIVSCAGERSRGVEGR
jgi:hypothetical protein